MPLNPVAVANAIVATPSTVGPDLASQNFAGPTGKGLRILQLGVPIDVKFMAVAGYTYSVGTNILPGDIAVYGPNGFPIGPSIGGTFSFTPLTTGLHVLEFIGNPRVVVAGQPIFVNIQAAGGIVPTTPTDALTIDYDIVKKIGDIARGGGENVQVVQYYLRPPDGNPVGIGRAASFDVEPAPQVVVGDESQASFVSTTDDLSETETALLTTDDSALDGSSSDQSCSNGLAATPGPVIRTNNGTPLSWEPPNALGSPDPTVITVALAESNYQSTAGIAPILTNSFPSAFLPLLEAAAVVWETVANIDFVPVRDAMTADEPVADIRIGLAALEHGTNPNTMGFVGYTTYRYGADGYFNPGSVLTIEDPAEHSVRAIGNGDYRYDNQPTTVFQTLLHELGHAIGLDHNTSDPNAIMNPLLGLRNPFVDASDIASAQSLYGPSRITPSQSQIETIARLIPDGTV